MRDLLRVDGENRAVRTFLMHYQTPGITVGMMRSNMEMAGWEGHWPDFVTTSHPDADLTKAGAQIWLRHLFSLESALATRTPDNASPAASSAHAAAPGQQDPEQGASADWTGDLIAAAEHHAQAYADDDRECITTDVINAFYAGADWARARNLPSGPVNLPAGWKPVPIYPTQAMLDSLDHADATMARVYRAMIAAAPALPPEDDHQPPAPPVLPHADAANPAAPLASSLRHILREAQASRQWLISDLANNALQKLATIVAHAEHETPEEHIYALWSDAAVKAIEQAGSGIGNGDVAHMLRPVIFARAIERTTLIGALLATDKAIDAFQSQASNSGKV